MRRAMAAAIAAATLVAGGAQAANLIQNGDFENYTLTPAQQAQTAGYVGFQLTYPSGTYAGAVDHWTASNANPAAYNLYFYNGQTATSGDAFSQYGSEQQRPNSNYVPLSPTSGGFMVLDGDPTFNGALEQVVNGLVTGKSYKLGFWYASGELSNRKGYQTEQLTGSFGGDAFATPTFFNSHPYNNNPGNLDGDFSGWQHASFTFTAHSASQVLSFLASGTPQANLPPVSFLDGVTLTGAPEPAVWGMMLLGFAALGARLRRRRALTA